MLLLLLLCSLAIAVQVQGECDAGCNEPTLFYEGIGCKPIYASPGDCCPCHYDCGHIEQRAKSDAEVCYFQGKTYNSGEPLDNEAIYGNCKVGCTCTKKQSGNMGFRCAILDCPEWLGHTPKFGCHFKYDLNKCCNVGEICNSTDVKCEVGGKTYYEGMEFNPSTVKCTKCICQKGFNGVFEPPFCKKQSCIEEVDHQKEIKNFCAPSFISKSDCCPFNWICPEETDTIIPAKAHSHHPDLKCKFGDGTFGIGDSFSRSEGKGTVSCECVIPPYFTCIQNYDYRPYAPEY